MQVLWQQIWSSDSDRWLLLTSPPQYCWYQVQVLQ